MKIVNLETFRSLPNGTVYTKYEPCCFEGLCVKQGTIEHDFFYESITDEIECHGSGDMVDKLSLAKETGCSIKMDFEATMRDGFFEENQLYAVWEKEDVEGLVSKLQKCLQEAY